jgi:hypothetical protein
MHTFYQKRMKIGIKRKMGAVRASPRCDYNAADGGFSCAVFRL